MSRTLFRYIFWDLFRIFMLASGVLSGIMSFGGLLRPLYEFGLSMSQVAEILAYSGPAMTAYSLPIAALFATTIVYGRFGADNEVTACRAAGISHLSIAIPAFALGLVTAFASIGLLCFVVPASMLRVEKVIFSNLAELSVSQIERSHKIDLDDPFPVTIFADSARVLPPDPANPRTQAVQLIGPLVVTYEDAERGKPQVPKEFSTAEYATAYIDQRGDNDEPTITVDVTGGSRFPRTPYTPTAKQGTQFTFGQQRIGPSVLTSPVKENTKFMDIFRLREMLAKPEDSQRLRATLRDYIRRDQQDLFLKELADKLNGPAGSIELAGSEETYTIARGAKNPLAVVGKDRLVVPGAMPDKPVHVEQTRGEQSLISANAGQVEIGVVPDADPTKMNVTIDMLDCVLKVSEIESPQKSPSRAITVAMPPEVQALTNRTFQEYLQSALPQADKLKLKRQWWRLTNSIVSELHARMSFALSCFILVMVGCALGMMFRSGNFLSAFAVSVVPALLSIALVVTGQHTCENVPPSITLAWQNPLNLGLMIIWSGNAAVLVIAVVLLVRLQRQ